MDTNTQCGRTFIHAAHDTLEGRCVGLTGDEVQATRDPWTLPDQPLSDSEPTWPRGPMVQHLRAIRQLYDEALSAVRLIIGGEQGLEAVDIRLVAIDHHLHHIAAMTANQAVADVTLRRPRPEVPLDDDGYPVLPEGWSSVVLGADTRTDKLVVLAGWTNDDTFHQYAPTEELVRVCTEALDAQAALNG